MRRELVERFQSLAIIGGLLVLVLVPVILLNRCGKSRDAAQAELQTKGFLTPSKNLLTVFVNANLLR